jgi:hypothetical protein
MTDADGQAWVAIYGWNASPTEAGASTAAGSLDFRAPDLTIRTRYEDCAMPIYEYTCKGCGEEFETLVRSSTTPIARVPLDRARKEIVGVLDRCGAGSCARDGPMRHLRRSARAGLLLDQLVRLSI